jgi:hypothetical protein
VRAAVWLETKEKNMRRVLQVFLVVFACALLVGCGGGGGGSSTLPISDTIRAMIPGDQWQYSINGTLSDGSTTLNVTGTWILTYSGATVTTPYSETAHLMLNSATFTVAGRTFTTSGAEYISQDASGTLWSHGGEDENGTYWVISPDTGKYVDVRSPMMIGTSWGDFVQTSDGDSDNTNCVVTATENVNVPAGRFEAFKVTENGYFGGLPFNGYEWWSPQIGAPVQLQGIIQDTDDEGNPITMNITVRLKLKTRVR